MRLPSLLYVQLESNYPSALFDVAIGDNVKHATLHGYPESAKLFVLPRHPSSGPLCVDSLDIHYPYRFLGSHFRDPNCRIETSRLRKLAVIANIYDDAAVFKPAMKPWTNLDDPIDLSKLTSLKRFAVHLMVTFVFDSTDYTTFPWFNRILLPKDARPVSQ